MFKHYFKAIVRNSWRNKTNSFLNIFGLAIGIACAGLIFLWAEDELTFDNVNTKKDRLYAVRNNQTWDGNTFTNWSSPRIMASSIKKDIPGIVNTCRVSDEGQNALFTIGDKTVYANGAYADPSVFTMFTVHFLQGNAQNAFGQLYSVVINQTAAKKFFGDEENIIGKTVRINNTHDYVVTGLIEDAPQNSTLQFEWYIPYQVNIAESEARFGPGDATSWDSYGPIIYAELAPNANLADINKQLHNYIHQKDASQTSHSFLFPMKDWRLYGEFKDGKQTGGGGIEQVRMLSAIAWIILLIACINFMNLATARSEKRAREVGVRKVLGSSKKSLVTQFIGEALFMSALSAIIAIVIMLLALPGFNQLVQKQLSLGITNPVHILALMAVILICGLIAGSYPSLYLSSFKPVAVLKGLKLKTGSAAFIRKGLVVTQFTLSVVFIISTIVIYMQIQHVKNRKLGFNKDNLVEIDMQHDITDKFSVIKQHLISTGAVENAATADHVMLYGGNTENGFQWEGKATGNDVDLSFRKVSPGFIKTYGMHLMQGRDFSANAKAENTNIIINKSLANLMGKESPVGKIIRSPRDQPDGVLQNLTVIGVVDNYVFGNMYDNSPAATILFCRPADDAHLVYARLRPQANTEDAIEKIEAVMKKDNPAYPLQYRFVDDRFNEMFFNEVLMSKISGTFAVLAIIISCLGLFGLAAYTAERRVKEIGIRKVLGASVAGLSALLSKDFLVLVGLSCLISFPIAGFIMHNWLQNYSYRISLSWWIFVCAGASALAIALCTISIQTIKAAIANPIGTLRNE